MKRRAASRWCSGPRRPRCCAPRRAPGTVRSTWPNPAGRHLATAGYDGQVLLWDPATGRPRHVLEGDGSAMWSVAVSRDGTSLVAVTMDGAAHLWDIGTAVEVCRLRVDGHLSACSFHPYGHRVVLGGSAGLCACEISSDAVDDR
ncbi:WD40 repeat domain-containing protein [Streptomyces mirabilis]|uniref:WD40 repeat domain-containing protein n=1 Tax=Streptomyces mirabilis TaxID=68239 RepID=UPI0036B4BEBE